MHYTYVPPPLPSLARWRHLYTWKKGISCLRAMEYEKLGQVPLAAPLLDVGGGRNSLYRDLLPGHIGYESVNIDPAIEPTHLVQPDGRFPVPDDRYATCLCLNTLEHIYDAKFVIDEIHRVLAPGGVVYITVPFIFRIHGHPDDFFRATPSWWRETLKRAGFAQASLQPLVWGRYTSGASIRGYRGLFKRTQFHLSHLADLIYARIAFSRNEGLYSGKRGERICGVALGYFITATK